MYNASLFERDVPKVSIEKEIEWNLKEPISVNISDASGLRFVKATLNDGEKSVVLESKEIKQPQMSVDLNLTFPKTKDLEQIKKHLSLPLKRWTLVNGIFLQVTV